MKREAKFIYSYARAFKWQIVIYIGIGILGTATSLLGSLVSKRLLDIVTGSADGSIVSAAVFFCSFGLFNLAVTAVSGRISAKISARVSNEIRADIYDKVIMTEWEVLTDFHSGDILSRITGDVSTVSQSIIGLIPNFITKLTLFVGSLVVVLFYEPIIALFALIGSPVMVLTSRFLIARMRDYTKKTRVATSRLTAFMEETFSNTQTVKAFGILGDFNLKMKALQADLIDVTLKHNKFSILTNMVMSFIGLIVSYLCYGWGVYRLWSAPGVFTFGSLTMLLQLASYLSSSFSALVSMVPTAISATTAAGRVMEIIQLPAERTDISFNVNPLKKLAAERGAELILNDIGFSYKNGTLVFSDASFDAKAGKITALIGPSGTGKTTLLRVMLSLVNYSGEGIIRIDGQDHPLSVDTRRLFAYVPQGNTLFSGTVAENLLMVRPDATEEMMNEALRLACADDFVSKLPEGINSPIAEKGGGVSEGQAQRIAIARALLSDAPILLLDEATSALDVATERRILRNIMNSDGSRTCILTTHRPSVLAICTEVYQIENNTLRAISEEEIKEAVRTF